jgi:uncharacterized protein
VGDLTAERIVELLGLKPHPAEGGYFAETYRSGVRLPPEALPGIYGGPRDASTGIYYLLTPSSISAMHRLTTDEIFHFYLGDSVEQLQLMADGSGRVVRLGPALERGERPQVVVPAGTWQGASLVTGGRFALLGCTVAPGFEYEDYEHGERDKLVEAYQSYADLITRLTPG